MKVILHIDPRASALTGEQMISRVRERLTSPLGELVIAISALTDDENTVLAEANNTTQRRGTAADHPPQVGERMYYYGGRPEYHGRIVTVRQIVGSGINVDIPGWGNSNGVRPDCLSWHDRSVPYSTGDTRRPVEQRTILSDPPQVGDRLFYYGNTGSWHGREVTVTRTTGTRAHQRWWVTFNDGSGDHRDNCPGTSLRWTRR